MLKNTYYLILFLAVFAALVVGFNIGKGIQKPQTTETENIPTPSPIITDITNESSPLSAPLYPSTSAGTLKNATSSGTTKGTLYTSSSCGIALTYPDTVALEESSTQTYGAVFTNTSNSMDMVVLTCQKNIPRPPLSSQNIETAMIGTVEAKLYHDTSAKDGAKGDALIFTHPKTKLDIFIGGYGSIFNALIQTIKIL